MHRLIRTIKGSNKCRKGVDKKYNRERGRKTEREKEEVRDRQ